MSGANHHGSRQPLPVLDSASSWREMPPVTATIAVACVCLFAVSSFWGKGQLSEALWRMGANVPLEVRNGEVWRLLSSAFLHLNVTHVVANMIGLLFFGLMLEKFLGARRYLLLYFLSALGGSLASAFFRDGGLSVGASGAVWGLMAAELGFALRPRGLLDAESRSRLFRGAALPIGINVYYSFQPGVDLYAHFGGGAVGLLLMISGVLTSHATNQGGATPRSERMWKASARAATFAMVVSMAVAILLGRPWQLRGEPTLQPVSLGNSGIAISIPTAIARKAQSNDNDGILVYTYGTLRGDPVAVEIVLVAHDEETDPTDVMIRLEEAQKTLEHTMPDGARRQTSPEILLVGGYPFVQVTYGIGDATMRSWLTVFGRYEVVVRVLGFPNRSYQWATVGEKVVASLSHPSKVPVPTRPKAAGLGEEAWADCTSKTEPNYIELTCGELVHIYYNRTTGSEVWTSDMRKNMVRGMAANLEEKGLVPKPIEAYLLSASDSDAVTFGLEDKETPAARDGTGVMAAISADATTLLVITCLDFAESEGRPPSDPDCQQRVEHLASAGLPKGVNFAEITSVSVAGQTIDVPTGCDAFRLGELRCGETALLWNKGSDDEGNRSLSAIIKETSKSMMSEPTESSHLCSIAGTRTECRHLRWQKASVTLGAVGKGDESVSIACARPSNALTFPPPCDKIFALP